MESAGRHLILDGYVKDAKVFDAPTLTEMFHSLVRALDMQLLLGPTFIEVPLDETKLSSDVFRDEGGITGVAVISTSHIAIHCWPLRRYFSCDVFSCKEFDVAKAMGVLHEFMGLDVTNVTNLERVKPQCPWTRTGS